MLRSFQNRALLVWNPNWSRSSVNRGSSPNLISIVANHEFSRMRMRPNQEKWSRWHPQGPDKRKGICHHGEYSGTENHLQKSGPRQWELELRIEDSFSR
jgi:hypothetical protein